MHHVTVKAIAHADHKEHIYSGIPLSEMIRKSGAIPGNQLRGKYLSKYVLVTGADGYQAVIDLPEIDRVSSIEYQVSSIRRHSTE